MLKFFFLSMALLVSAVTLAPGTEEPPELIARRKEHLRLLKQVSIQLWENQLLSLQALKQQYASKGDLKSAVAVVAEIKGMTEVIDAANRQIVIISSTYGNHVQNRVVDTTKRLRELMESGQVETELEGNGHGEPNDPAPNLGKDTIIIYTVNGQRKEKAFPEDFQLNFARDLK